ncbi:MAG: hypothetical protein ABW328_19075 [Ilumatobacteraceae bacterium]
MTTTTGSWRHPVIGLAAVALAIAGGGSSVALEVGRTAAPPAIATTPAASPATSAAPVASSPETTLTHGPLALQTVPAVAGVLVDVGGRRLVTDAAGTVVLDPGEVVDAVSIVGLGAGAAQQVQFVGWADGDARPSRPADSLRGPIAEIGLDVKELVTVTIGDDAISGGQVTFSSALGAIDVPIDAATWITSARAVPTGAGLRVEQLEYTAVSVTIGALRDDAIVQRYTPSRHALWIVAF